MKYVRKFFLNMKMKRLQKQADFYQKVAESWYAVAEEATKEWNKAKKPPVQEQVIALAEVLFFKAIINAERTAKYAEHFRERIKTLEMIE